MIAFTCLEHHQRYGCYFVVVKRETRMCPTLPSLMDLKHHQRDEDAEAEAVRVAELPSRAEEVPSDGAAR